MDKQEYIYNKKKERRKRAPRGIQGVYREVPKAKTNEKDQKQSSKNQNSKIVLGNTENISNKRVLHIMNQASPRREIK